MLPLWTATCEAVSHAPQVTEAASGEGLTSSKENRRRSSVSPQRLKRFARSSPLWAESHENLPAVCCSPQRGCSTSPIELNVQRMYPSAMTLVSITNWRNCALFDGTAWRYLCEAANTQEDRKGSDPLRMLISLTNKEWSWTTTVTRSRTSRSEPPHCSFGEFGTRCQTCASLLRRVDASFDWLG